VKVLDYLILALVALVVLLAVRQSVKKRASGVACGCGGCAGCSVRENCTEQGKEK
jgi:hypothetical protein